MLPNKLRKFIAKRINRRKIKKPFKNVLNKLRKFIAKRINRRKIKNSFNDILESIKMVRVSIWMGWLGSSLPFRNTKIGIFWMTLTGFVWIFTIGFLFKPSSIEIPFLSYVALGISIFTTIRIFLGEGTNVFIKQSLIILNIPNPFFIYVINIIVKAVLNFIMLIPVIILALFIDKIKLSYLALLAIPGFLIMLLFGIGACLILGSLTSRYKDVSFIMQAILRLLFFASPLFWVKSHGLKAIVAEVNPLYHIITIIRAPILGYLPDIHNYYISIIFSVVVLLIGFILFTIVREKMAYWL